MQEVPDDLFQSDVHSFPREDPVTAAKLKTEMEKARKMMEAEEKARMKAAKAEEAAAKKAAGTKVPDRIPNAEKPAAAAGSKSKSTLELKTHKVNLYLLNRDLLKLQIKEPKGWSSNEESVDKFLAAIEVELSSRGGIENAGTMYSEGVSTLAMLNERFGNPLGVQLVGPAVDLRQTLQASKAKWQPIVTEFAISNCEW